MVITAVDCVTAIGLDAESTAAAVRAGISRLRKSDQFSDSYGNSILETCIPWLKPEEELDLPNEDSGLGDEVEDDETGAAEAGEVEYERQDDRDGDPYELARQADTAERVTGAARDCLEGLLQTYAGNAAIADRTVSLFLGVSTSSRPGPRFEGTTGEFANHLLASTQQWAGQAQLAVIDTGNASVIRGLELAAEQLEADPSAICIVGGIDSLLSLETLNWYESAERLKSDSQGRNHGLSPAEGVGFLVVESAASAARGRRRILAEVAGIGLAVEPSPFIRESPSRGQGLTEACRTAMTASAIPLGEFGTVVCDLDGEFHRSKEWALAEIRCFGNAGARTLFHPADCWGTIGAASGALLIDFAAVAFARSWLTKPVIVFCSDDAGECGAVVLTRSGRD